MFTGRYHKIRLFIFRWFPSFALYPLKRTVVTILTAKFDTRNSALGPCSVFVSYT